MNQNKKIVWATAIIAPIVLVLLVASMMYGPEEQANAEPTEIETLTEQSLKNAENLKIKKEEQHALETKLELVKTEVKTLQTEKEKIRTSIDSYINKNISPKSVSVNVFTNPPNLK